jgi:hypothetical protein
VCVKKRMCGGVAKVAKGKKLDSNINIIGV